MFDLGDLHGDRATVQYLAVLRAQAQGVRPLRQQRSTTLVGTGGQQRHRQEVHARAADEAGYKRVHRVVVELQGRAHLLNAARAQHHDLVGHGHGLHLVVGHIDHGGLQPRMQIADLRPHRYAQFGVQVRQGLIKQEQFGFAHDGAADRHALALPAGQLGWLALQQLPQPQQRGRRADLGLDLGPGCADVLQPERHVVVDRHVRVQRIRLEHHGAAALCGRHGIHVDLIDPDVTRTGRLQACYDAQQRGFAATRRPDEHHKLTVRDAQVDAVQDGGLVEGLDDAVQIECGHGAVLGVRSTLAYFTPALAIPVVMYFCRNANTRVIGISVITVIASR